MSKWVSILNLSGWHEELIINPVFLVVCIPTSRANRNLEHSRDGITDILAEMLYQYITWESQIDAINSSMDWRTGTVAN